jgi:hypothetical protein
MKAFAVLLLSLSLVSGALWAAPQEWKKVREKDGVTVYVKEVGQLVAVRGEGQIEASMGKLLHVIEDSAHWKEWIDNFENGGLLEMKTPFHKVFYQSFDSPFPVKDRYLVYESKTRRDAKNGRMYLEMRSVDHEKAPKRKGIRADLKYTRYEITPLPDGRLRVVFETLSDSKGALPKFLVNQVQRKYPVKLFQGLRRQVRKPHAKNAPLPPPQ